MWIKINWLFDWAWILCFSTLSAEYRFLEIKFEEQNKITLAKWDFENGHLVKCLRFQHQRKLSKTQRIWRAGENHPTEPVFFPYSRFFYFLQNAYHQFKRLALRELWSNYGYDEVPSIHEYVFSFISLPEFRLGCNYTFKFMLPFRYLSDAFKTSPEMAHGTPLAIPLFRPKILIVVCELYSY